MRIDFIQLETAEAIAIADVKRFSRVDISADDAMITDLFIPAARQYCEAYINCPIVPQTKDIWYDFCIDKYSYSPVLTLPYNKNIRVASIVNFDDDATETTFAAASYGLSGNRIILNDGYEWSYNVRDYDSMRIELVSGFGTYSDPNYTAVVPEAIKTAMSMIVAHYIQQREAQADVDLKNVPMGVTALLAPYRNFIL